MHVRFTESSDHFREEYVPGNRAIFQSDTAKTYKCPTCLRPVFTQYEGVVAPTIKCEGMGGHFIRWDW